MCDKRPGVRCSDYATSTLKITKNRLEKIKTQLSEYEEKYADSLANTEKPTPNDTIKQNKHQRLVESAKQHQQIVDGAEFEYYSCPVGQAELQEELAKAVEAGDVPLQEQLQARIAAAEDYRTNARQNLRELEQIEATEGPEAAAEAGWQKFEEAAEVETEAIILGDKAKAELEAARAESEEYNRAMEEYRKNNRIDTPEEEKEKERKRKMQLVLIGALAAAVLAYGLVKQSAGGQKSSMLSYGKNMMMRQAMTGGRQFIAPLLRGNKKEEEAREQRAEKEAEDRAASARERVLRNHEKSLAEDERKKLRDEERLADLSYRNTLREQDREAERQKRADELAHLEQIAAKFKDLPLTPEMQAVVASKMPQVRRPPQGRKSNSAGSSGENSNGRQYSNRRRGQSQAQSNASTPTAKDGFTGEAAPENYVDRQPPQDYSDIPMPEEPAHN